MNKNRQISFFPCVVLYELRNCTYHQQKNLTVMDEYTNEGDVKPYTVPEINIPTYTLANDSFQSN